MTQGKLYELVSVWFCPDTIPENGRKIEMVFSPTQSPEVDTWDNGLVLGYVDWENVIMWRYVTERSE